MPNYLFRCSSSCEWEEVLLVRVDDRDNQLCPECSAPAERVPEMPQVLQVSV